MTRCPVLLFDEDVELAVTLFGHCYRLSASGRHERVLWPSAGGEFDQDAWLLEALAIIAETVDDERAEQLRQEQDGAALMSLQPGQVGTTHVRPIR